MRRFGNVLMIIPSLLNSNDGLANSLSIVSQFSAVSFNLNIMVVVREQNG